MADLLQAAESVRRWVEKQRDIIALGDALKEIGSIDQARSESQAALDKVNAEHTAKVAELAAVKTELPSVIAARAKEVEAHKATLQGLTDAANKNAEGIVDRAKKMAADTISAANAEAARVQKAHGETMTGLAAELMAKRGELADVQRQIAIARNEHDTLQANIAAMRKAARAVVGATG